MVVGKLQHWQATGGVTMVTNTRTRSQVVFSCDRNTLRTSEKRCLLWVQELSAHIKAIKGDPYKVSLWFECVSNITVAVCCLCHALVVLLFCFLMCLFNHDLFTMFSDNEAVLCIQNINNLTAQLSQQNPFHILH